MFKTVTIGGENPELGAAWRRRLGLSLAVLMAMMTGACASVERMALPTAELADVHWRDQGTGPAPAIDHGPWDRFLKSYVTTDSQGVNRVRYGEVTDTDKQSLNDYLAAQSRVPVTGMARDARLAFWINLYNALTVNLVIDHFPVDSIRDIKSGFFSIGPWNMTVIEVEGRELTLNDIEHGILRPLWGDPRIHYVLNCAAAGCPNLRREAFTAANVDQLLEAGARAFINDSRGVAFDGRGRLTVSKIYNWYREDFGDSEEAVLDHIRLYAEPALRQRLDAARRIDKYRYDWSLNGAEGG